MVCGPLRDFRFRWPCRVPSLPSTPSRSQVPTSSSIRPVPFLFNCALSPCHALQVLIDYTTWLPPRLLRAHTTTPRARPPSTYNKLSPPQAERVETRDMDKMETTCSTALATPSIQVACRACHFKTMVAEAAATQGRRAAGDRAKTA